jgi:hypothetical protein
MSTLDVNEIVFADGNCARVVHASPDVNITDIVARLEVNKPEALLVIIGGAGQIDRLSESKRARLAQLFSRGLALAAHERRAAIIDGGTHSGVMAMIGQAVADRDYRLPLIGVAPYHNVKYPGKDVADAEWAELDPNHTLFVATDTHAFGSETDTLFHLAETLGQDIPVAVVLAGGGVEGVAKQEVLHSVRHGWPVIVIDGSGGIADRIASLKREQNGIASRRARSGETILRRLWYQMNPKELGTNDAALLEILADGKLTVLESSSSGEQLHQIVTQKLPRPPAQNEVLKLAWQRFADYDKNAGRQQRAFEQLQQWLLGLGVLVTLLAISTPRVANIPIGNGQVIFTSVILRAATLIVTVLITGLTAYRNFFAAGPKWILLRANAESIKSEIYPYRAQADVYGAAALGKKPNKPSRDVELADRVAAVGRRTMRTEVSASALEPYDESLPPTMFGAAGKDDGFSDLAPEAYIKIRIDDQLSYYRKKTVKFDRDMKRYQILVFVAAGVGTLLAALAQEPWIPLTASLAAVFASIIEYRQLGSTLIKYNQAETDLTNLKLWWDSLSNEQKGLPDKVDTLVRLTEEINSTEIAGWARRMQNVLEELRKESEAQKTENSSK